jgi:tRNA threonylcarbamoyladenosine biosynthesis protein TsaB
VTGVDFLPKRSLQGRVVTLALDTSTRAGSVAVRRDGVLVRAHVGAADVPHGRRLPGALLDLLAAGGVTLPEVTLYAVASGPGAFTGLRIGIATMQGLAFAHGRPLAGVSALEACAYAVREDAATAGTPVVAVWMDAARREVFTALFARDPDGHLRPADEPAVESPHAALARCASVAGDAPVLFAGDGAVRYKAAIDVAFGERAVVLTRVPALADAIGERAEAAAARGLAGPPHAVRPLYVRRPDAELAREREQPASPSKP